MNGNWNTALTSQAQALCLRNGVRVPVASGLESVSAMTMNKDFIYHAAGGSDG